ncbi:hypothetical protein [Helicobacter burdigaliensis]|uniref:hypothetical protein n=1 Tax=Helicobacter burdigaliensis TaxID=2315334 RepID=UPI000EF676B4|nr:hypothetical protein [Helicobacter burdigaliensis]
MKKIVLLIISIGILSFSGCSSNNDNNLVYGSSNCDEAKRICLNKCAKQGKSRRVCLDECEKARGMCEAIKVKGCLQDCNLQYGKGTSAAEQCKLRCTKK